MNVLFIGDCRTARNYGSIATTEAMLKMINTELREDDELKIITRRSFDVSTPLDGIFDKPVKLWKRYIKSFLPKPIVSILQSIVHPKKNIYDLDKHIKSMHIPYRFSQFEHYYNEMMIGERLQFEKNLLFWADVVIFNGEGNVIIGTDKYGTYTKGGLYTIFMCWMAKQKFGKPVSLVNHIVDPDNEDVWEMIEHTYPFLDHILVRDPISLQKLREHNIMNVEYVSDALFTYEAHEEWTPSDYLKQVIDFTQPYICLGCSTALNTNAYQTAAKWDHVYIYTKLIQKLKDICPQIIFIDGFREQNKSINTIIKKNKLPYVNLLNCPYQDLYHVLEHSSLFISGRWHASILALLSNTPIILYGADSHKTQALYDVINYDYPFFEIQTLPIHIDEIVGLAKELIDDGQVKRHISKQVEINRISAKRNVEFLHKVLHHI